MLVDAGPVGEWAEAAMRDDFVASPELALAEASNILRRLERSGQVGRVRANRAYEDLMGLDLEVFPFSPFADRVWELRGSLTSYDAWYVALAEALACSLVTLDRRLSRATGPTCRILIPPR